MLPSPSFEVTKAGASGRVLAVFNANLSARLNGTDSGDSSVGPGSGAVPALGMPPGRESSTVSAAVPRVWGSAAAGRAPPREGTFRAAWQLLSDS